VPRRLPLVRLESCTRDPPVEGSNLSRSLCGPAQAPPAAGVRPVPHARWPIHLAGYPASGSHGPRYARVAWPHGTRLGQFARNPTSTSGSSTSATANGNRSMTKGGVQRIRRGYRRAASHWEPAVANRSRFPEITAGLVDVDPAPRERWSSEGRQRREDQRGLATPSNHGIGSAKPYQNAASTGSQASASTAPSFISCQTTAANALAMTAARRMRGVGG
jgi:hypothetical protein